MRKHGRRILAGMLALCLLAGMAASQKGTDIYAAGTDSVSEGVEPPVDESPADDEETIEDEAVPETAPENLEQWALANLIAALLTVLICLVLFITLFTGRRRVEDEDETDRRYEYIEYEKPEEETEYELKRRTLVRLGSIIPAAAAVLLFVFTENLRNPMTLMDHWTLLMLTVLIVQLIVAFLSKKRRVDDEDGDEGAVIL
jgi:hypothetical protein